MQEIILIFLFVSSFQYFLFNNYDAYKYETLDTLTLKVPNSMYE
jgi:hypothetical protein